MTNGIHPGPVYYLTPAATAYPRGRTSETRALPRDDRRTLMTNRVAALQTALELVSDAKSHHAT